MGRIIDRIGWALAGALGLGLIVVVAGIVDAGPLDPSDPPAPTMKSLDAVEPRTPISPGDIPLTITQPGSYYLTGNIGATPIAAIDVVATDVTIDLNGFSMASNGGGTAVRVGSGLRVVVRNGIIENWDQGVSTSFAATQLRVSDMLFYGNQTAVSLGNGSVLEDCTINNSTIRGVATLSYALIQRCLFSNNGVGVEFFGTQNTVRDNAFIESATLSVKYADLSYINNVVLGNRFNCADAPSPPPGNFQPFNSAIDDTNYCLP